MARVFILPVREFLYARAGGVAEQFLPVKLLDGGIVDTPEKMAQWEHENQAELPFFDFEEHQARNIVARGNGIIVGVEQSVIPSDPAMREAYEMAKAKAGTVTVLDSPVVMQPASVVVRNESLTPVPAPSVAAPVATDAANAALAAAASAEAAAVEAKAAAKKKAVK